MQGNVWQHLLAWELRYALRRSAIYLMALTAALGPVAFGWAMARAYDRPEPLLYAPACGAQVVLLSPLIASWTVLSARRQVSSELSDDWLLVITWRQSLLVRHLAAAVLGLAMAALSIVTMLAAGECLNMQGYVWLVRSQAWVLGAALQGVAAAAIVVAASDFLLASMATVLSVQLTFALLWSFVPFVGFFWPVWLLTDPDNLGTPDSAMLFGRVAVLACLALFAFAWLRSEDFWLLLQQRRRRGYDASIGEVRSEIAGARAGASAGGREAAAAARARWRRLRLPAWLAADLARYPVLSLPRGSRGWLRAAGLTVLVGVVLLVYVSVCTATGRDVLADGSAWRVFGWWLASAVVLLRAVSSGVQIVAQEREQGTLANLAVTPLGLASVLNGKVLVVMVQTVPWAAVLWFARLDGNTIPSRATWHVEMIVTAATLAVCAAAVVRGRLAASALAVGSTIAMMGALVPATSLMVEQLPLAFRQFGGPPEPFDLPGLMRVPGPLYEPALIGLFVLFLVLVWFLCRGVALVVLRRSAGSQTA